MECQEIKSRVVVVTRVLVNEALEVETNSMRLKLGESRRQHSNQKIEKEHERDKKIQSQKESSFKAFRLNIVK